MAPTEATIRLVGESEHHVVDETYHVRIEPYQARKLVNKPYIHVDLNHTYEVWELSERIHNECLTEEVANSDAGIRLDFVYKGLHMQTVEGSEDLRLTHEEFTVCMKGIYAAVVSVRQANLSIDHDYSIIAGDYPYLREQPGMAYPGHQVRISAEPLMKEAEGKEIEFSVEGNERVTIDSQGNLDIGPGAAGEVTVSAKPKGTDIAPSQLTVRMMGYQGLKKEDSLTEGTMDDLDSFSARTVYVGEYPWKYLAI